MKEMIVKIDKNGNISIDTNGFTGDECIRETKKLEQALGVVTSREKKPSFYARIKRTVGVNR